MNIVTSTDCGKLNYNVVVIINWKVDVPNGTSTFKLASNITQTF